MSKIIVLEGADRCGKATQSRMLCNYLNDRGESAVLIEVPIWDRTTYSLIYWMLGNGLAKKLPKLFQWLQCLNRWIFQTFTLVQVEHRYDYVIFDRWSLSTSVYGRATGLSESYVDGLYEVLRRPDFTILLIGKSHRHVAEDVYERDHDLQAAVRFVYRDWASRHGSEAHVVDSELPKEDVHEEIIAVLKSKGLIRR